MDIPAIATQDFTVERYAELIIGPDPSRFDSIEVQGVRSYQTGAGSYYEVDNVNPEAYSVYLHQTEAGVECVGDMSRRQDALEYAAELSKVYGWPIHDHSPENPSSSAYRIADEMLFAAVKIDDLDTAVRSVMDQVGMTDGTVAGCTFCGQYEDDWPTADPHYRLSMLREWRDNEQANARDDA